LANARVQGNLGPIVTDIWFATMPDKKESLTWADWLGLRTDIRRAKTRWLGRTLGFGLMALTLMAAAIFVALLALLFIAFFSLDDGADVRNIGLALAAVVGAPFVMWRSAVAAKQAQIAEESLFNDKINAAAADLAARRQVTTVIGEGDTRQVLSEWRDDLVTRAAAIDRLEGLVEERPDAAPRVARMLSVYVRELSREHPPQNHPRVEWLRLTEQDGKSAQEAATYLEMKLDDETVGALRTWAHGLQPVRSDMEKAAQTLGRLKDIAGVVAEDVPIDLRGANLQGFDLHGLTFEKAQMQGARLEGANLRAAQMEGAILSAAQFDEKTNFTFADVQYAAVKSANYEAITLGQSQVNSLFGDGSATLPAELQRPAHWPAEDLGLDEFIRQWRVWQVENGYTAQSPDE